MDELFTIPNLLTLLTLTALEAVLGFDNILYISLEAKKVPAERQKYVRKIGIILAIGLRIVLLFVILKAIQHFQNPFVSFHWENVVEAKVSVHSLIVLLGGGLIVYTAFKEIFHMLAVDDLDKSHGKSTRTVRSAIIWILIMNIVFSFDTVLSAVALTDNFWVMAIAIVASGVLMVAFADHISTFLERNRMFEVLGLFVLFIIGIMLLSEGGHIAHLEFFGHPIEPMAKSTFYFVLVVLLAVDIVQSRYQKKLLARESRANAAGGATQ